MVASLVAGEPHHTTGRPLHPTSGAGSAAACPRLVTTVILCRLRRKANARNPMRPRASKRVTGFEPATFSLGSNA